MLFETYCKLNEALNDMFCTVVKSYSALLLEFALA